MTVSKNSCRNHIEPEKSSRPGDKSKFEKGIKVRRSYWSLGVFGSGKKWWCDRKKSWRGGLKERRGTPVFIRKVNLKKTITLCSNVLDYVVKIAWYFVLKKSNTA